MKRRILEIADDLFNDAITVDQAKSLLLNLFDVKKKCFFLKYGEVERICNNCGYVIWEKEGKSNDEIIDNMIKAGYEAPICRN
jgi:hypothetical protein